MVRTRRPQGETCRESLPLWIKPELAQLVKAAPDGPGWLHEIKLDGYRMHARLEAGAVKIIMRRGNDWTDKYPTIAKSLATLDVKSAYVAPKPALIPYHRALSPHPLMRQIIVFCTELQMRTDDAEVWEVPPSYRAPG
jgi:hypothetical protein